MASRATIPPAKIINYELKLIKVLGSGSFGEVYLAEPVKGRKKSTFTYPDRVAVKIIHQSLCTPADAADLLKELSALRRLQHPCIVGYLGVWKEMSVRSGKSGRYCLAMTHCDGGDVEALLMHHVKNRLHFTTDILINLMACVFAGLNYSHSHRFIHRDIKPANIFLASSETDQGVKQPVALIGDYGLARPLDKTMQLVKTRVGTPCYCSPEIVLSKAYSGKTDVFSAGVMFYELMTLESPFWSKRMTDMQCFYQIVNHDPVPRLRAVCAGLYDDTFVTLVARCLSKSEAERPTAFEVLTTFSARIQRRVADMRLPLYSDKTAPAADGAVARQRDALRPVKPVDSPPTAVSSHTPKKVKAAAAEAAARADGGGVAVDRVARFLQADFPSRADATLVRVTGGNLELFSVLKILVVSRRESGCFQDGERDRSLLRNVILDLCDVVPGPDSIEAIVDAAMEVSEAA